MKQIVAIWKGVITKFGSNAKHIQRCDVAIDIKKKYAADHRYVIHYDLCGADELLKCVTRTHKRLRNL